MRNAEESGSQAGLHAQIVHSFFLGLIAAIAKENTGKVASAMGIHVFHNALVTPMLLLLGSVFAFPYSGTQ